MIIIKKLPVVLALCVVSGVSHAAVNISKSGLVCQDGQYTATCSGKVTGLGTEDIFIALDIPGRTVPVSTMCFNPSGLAAPGKNPARYALDIEGFSYVNSSAYTKNGQYTFSVSTFMPDVNIDWKSAGCPNKNWTAEITDFHFQNVNVSILVYATKLNEEGDVVPDEDRVLASTTVKVSR